MTRTLIRRLLSLCKDTPSEPLGTPYVERLRRLGIL